MQLEGNDFQITTFSQNGKSHSVSLYEKQQVTNWQQQLENYIKLINRNISRGQAVGTKGYSELNTIRVGLRNFIEERILENYESSKQADLDQTLWQIVIYPQSSELKRRAKSIKDSGDKVEIKKVLTFSQEFFGQTIDFLTQLIQKLQIKYGSVGVNLQTTQSGALVKVKENKSNTDASNTVYRFLINIGDLLRYEQQINQTLNQGQGKELSRAEQYYKIAGEVSGHWEYGTHLNQQALISSYREDVVGSIYFYFRCLAVAHPFNNVRENLLLEFETVRKEYKDFQSGIVKSAKNPHSPHESSSGRSGGRSGRYRQQSNPSSSSQNLSIVKTFKRSYREVAVEFLCMYGMIFDHIDLDRFEEVYERSSKALQSLLSNQSYVIQLIGKSEGFQKSIFFRLCIINIYLGDKTLGDTDQSKTLGFGSMAVSVLLSLLGNLLSVWATFREESGQNGLGDIVLATVQVASQWLIQKSSYVRVQEQDKQTVDSRRMFFDGCIKFLDYIYAEKSDIKNIGTIQTLNQQKGLKNNLALPEDRELRGFLPLKPQHSLMNFKKGLEDYQNLNQAQQGCKKYIDWYRKYVIVQRLKQLEVVISKDGIVQPTEESSDEVVLSNKGGLATTQQIQELEAKYVEFQQKLKGTQILEGANFNVEYQAGVETAKEDNNEVVKVKNGMQSQKQFQQNAMIDDDDEEELLYQPNLNSAQLQTPKSAGAQDEPAQEVQTSSAKQSQLHYVENQNENQGAINNQKSIQSLSSGVAIELKEARPYEQPQVYAGSYNTQPQFGSTQALPYTLPRPSPNLGFKQSSSTNQSMQSPNTLPQMSAYKQLSQGFVQPYAGDELQQGHGYSNGYINQVNPNVMGQFGGDKEYGNTLDGLEQTALQAANLVLDVDGQQNEYVNTLINNGHYQQAFASSQQKQEQGGFVPPKPYENQGINEGDKRYSMGMYGGLQSSQGYEYSNSQSKPEYNFVQLGQNFIPHNTQWKDTRQHQITSPGSLSSPLVAPQFQRSSNPFAIAMHSPQPQQYQNGQHLSQSYDYYNGQNMWANNSMMDKNMLRKNNYQRQTSNQSQRSQQHPTNPFVP